MSRANLPVLLLSLFGGALLADAVSADERTPEQWLDTMNRAFLEASYDGIFSYFSGDDLSTMRVVHTVTNGVQRERLVHLNGAPREIVRTGDEVECILRPGDEILAPRPSYPLFEFLANLESVRVRQYPLRYDGVWHIDFDALKQAITPRTKGIVVVNPNNPTGSFLKRAELDLLDALAAERGLAILSDEVFRDYQFGDEADRVSTLVGDRRALTFSMSGLSKIAGLPQMKLGWIVASGPNRSQALDALELIADTYLSVSTPVQVALPRLLELSGGILKEIRQRTASNLAHLRAAIHGTAGTLLRAEGGWYAVLQVPRTRTEEEWTLKLLDESGVLVQPGFFFDFDSEAFLVLSLLPEPPIFAEGVARLRAII